MRVLREGQPETGEAWSGDCVSCGAVVLANESELTHIKYSIRDHLSFSWQTCPECGAGEPDSGYGGVVFYPFDGD